MFKKQISLFLPLFLISFAVYPNNRPFPGYYISNSGDSVRCDIEFNDWNINPKTIKIQANNRVQEFGPQDIKGFGVDGYDDYISATISFHDAPVSGKEIPEIFSDSIKTRTCFLKILDKGYYSLYDLILPERVYLFTGHHDSTISELIYRVREKNDSIEIDQNFKKELFSLFVREGISSKYFNRINNTYYNAADIGSLFRILNENHTGVKYKKKSSGEFQAQIFIGAIRNSFPTSFTGDFSSTNQFDPSFSPGGGLNLLYSIPGFFKSFKVGLSAGYNGYNYKLIKSGTTSFKESDNYYGTTIYNDTLTTSNTLLQTNVYVLYIVNPLSNMKVFLKTGINYNFSLNNNIDVISKSTGSTTGIRNGNVPFENNTTNDHSLITIKNRFPSFLVAAGIIEGRHTLEISYCPSTEIADSPSGNSFKFSSMAIYYYFSLFSTK